MIEIGQMGNWGRAAMQRILQEVEAATGDSADLACCITEADMASGYWWRYQPVPHHPNEALIAMIHIAKVVADTEVHHTGQDLSCRINRGPNSNFMCSRMIIGLRPITYRLIARVSCWLL